MPAYAIPKTFPSIVPKKRPEKRKDYLNFVRALPCAVTGKMGVEAAHVSYASPWHGHYGRAHGTKAPDRFAIPLCAEQHALQHSQSEEQYWHDVGICPHDLANALWGIWSDYDEYEATERATSRIMQGLGRKYKGF